MTLPNLLAEHPHLLLDFDGPVCAVFGGISARHTATHLAAVLRDHGVPLPADAGDTDDPFDILRAAAQLDAAPLAEAALRDLEVHAVQLAPPTPGIRGMLDALHDAGHTVTIVSNNSAAAVGAFLRLHDLGRLVRGVVARTEPDPALLKPNPHLVHRAVQQLGADPADCVLLGDSTTDITAARAAGTAVIAYANKPHKRTILEAHHPEQIIETLREISQGLRSSAARR